MKQLRIAFEGADNLGKTTVAKIVCEKLGFEYTKFPNEENYSGKVLREILQGKKPFEPASFQALNIIDRLFTELADKVIIDRHVLSGKIYGENDGLPSEWVDQLLAMLIQPDLTFVFVGTPFTTDNELYDMSESIAKRYNEYVNANRGNPAVVEIYANRLLEVVVSDIIEHIVKFESENI